MGEDSDHLSVLDPSFVVDPFTLTVLIGIAVWLDRRLRNVEKTVAYNRGYQAGRADEREVNEKK